MTLDALPEVFSQEFIFDPLPQIARLRVEDPIHWVDHMDLWFVTRHDDVKLLLSDGELATPDRRAWERYEAPAEGTYMRWIDDNNLLSVVPSEHRRIRRLVTTAFTPKAIARMEAEIAEVVTRFAEPLRRRTGLVDLMGEFCDPIPNTVISRITGIPPAGDDEARFRRIAQDIIANAIPFSPADTKVRAEHSMLELTTWIQEMAKERTEDPRDDLISDLVATNDMQDSMTSDEIVTLVAGLVAAGSETTALGGLIAIMSLLENPDVLARIRVDRSLMPQAVMEIIRHGMGGLGALPRYAVRDFELRGKSIRKGQMIMLSFGGANRDPSVFSDPDRFDIERDQSRLLSFGFGAHYCLGVHLAKAEIRAMVDALCDVLPEDVQLRPELMEFRSIGLFPRPTVFPAEFGPGDG